MNERIKSYNVKIEVLGPLFVGSGQEVKKSEYIYDSRNKKIYIMDIRKMYEGLKKIGKLECYEDFITKTPNPNLGWFVRENKIESSQYVQWAAYSFNAMEDTKDKNSNIMAFVKDAYNMPYLPGSSFKGAVRNALLNAVVMSDKYKEIAKSAETNINNYDYKRRKAYLSQESKGLDVKAFHVLSDYNERKGIKPEHAVNSMFRGFVVSDSKPLKPEDIVLCEKIDVTPNGKKCKIGMLRECIKPGTVVELTVSIDTEVFDYNAETLENEMQIMYNNIKRKFLEDFPKTAEYKGNLIYIGGGTGFPTKTAVYSLFSEKERAVKNTSIILDKLFPKTANKRNMIPHSEDLKRYGVSPRTRKCTMYNNEMYDFGLCRVDFQPIQ